jgi:hypothetical protein
MTASPAGVVAERGQQAPVAVGAVGDGQRRNLVAAVIDQRGGVLLLVDVDRVKLHPASSLGLDC